jgi:hypothetical protein
LLSDSAKFDVPAFLWCRPPSEKASGGTRKKAEKDYKSGQTFSRDRRGRNYQAGQEPHEGYEERAEEHDLPRRAVAQRLNRRAHIKWGNFLVLTPFCTFCFVNLHLRGDPLRSSTPSTLSRLC